jgi:uncharacterized oxidoreductase
VQLRNTKVKVFDLAALARQTELLDGFDVEDMKGASIMKVEDMVKVAVQGIQSNRFEIRPGQANQLKTTCSSAATVSPLVSSVLAAAVAAHGVG